jgi:hypothetical protein
MDNNKLIAETEREGISTAMTRTEADWFKYQNVTIVTATPAA